MADFYCRVVLLDVGGLTETVSLGLYAALKGAMNKAGWVDDYLAASGTRLILPDGEYQSAGRYTNLRDAFSSVHIAVEAAFHAANRTHPYRLVAMQIALDGQGPLLSSYNLEIRHPPSPPKSGLDLFPSLLKK